jgi:hypothetical protein
VSNPEESGYSEWGLRKCCTLILSAFGMITVFSLLSATVTNFLTLFVCPPYLLSRLFSEAYNKERISSPEADSE